MFELLPVLLLGVAGGLLGSSFIVLNARLNAWRKRNLLQYGWKVRAALTRACGLKARCCAVYGAG